MSKLPDGWILKPLGEIGEVRGGKRLPKGEHLSKSDTGYIYLRVSDMNEDGTVLDDLHYLPAHLAPKLSRYRVRTGDLYIVVVGNTVGKCGMIPPELDNAFLTENANRITAIKANPTYLLAVLRSPIVQSAVERIRTDNAQPKLALTRLRNFKIPLPPLAEQRKIAEILSTWDEAIQLVDALIAALKERKRGLMQRLLTGEVRFPGFDGEWEEMQIDDLGEIFSGGTPDTNNLDYWDGDIAWVTPTEITALSTKYIDRTRRTITQAGLKASSARIIEPYSIILCTRATIGDAAINLIPMATNQGFKNLTLRDGHNTEFVYYLITQSKHHLKRLANGSTFLELSKGDFGRMRFLVPKPDEQAKIAETIDQFDVYIEGAYQYISQLREQKKGLMQRLLTGEVRVDVSDDV